MPNNDDLINNLNDDLPTNVFTIDDEDPMVILGKLNAVIKLLENIDDDYQQKLTEDQLDAVNSGIDATKVAQIETNKNDITNLGNNKQDKLSTAQLDAVNSGIDSAKVGQIATNKNNIEQLSNPNLLINGDFRVNQRGQTSYTTTGLQKYSADRWCLVNTGATFDTTTKTFSNSGTGNVFLSQFIEGGRELLAGKKVAISMSVSGVIYSNSGTLPSTLTSTQYLTTDIITGVKMRIDNSATNAIAFQIRVEPSYSVSIDWCKLEVGSVATPFSPRPYAEELALCQRYYQKIRIHGGAGASSNTTDLYPIFPLPTQLRNPITITTINLPLIRGNGTTQTATSITYNSNWENGLQLLIKGVGLTQYYVYSFVNGDIEADAEIY